MPDSQDGSQSPPKPKLRRTEPTGPASLLGGQSAYAQMQQTFFAPQPAGMNRHPTGTSGGIMPPTAGQYAALRGTRALRRRSNASSRRVCFSPATGRGFRFPPGSANRQSQARQVQGGSFSRSSKRISMSRAGLRIEHGVTFAPNRLGKQGTTQRHFFPVAH